MIRYIKSETAPFSVKNGNRDVKMELLWGDQFQIESGPDNGFVTGWARGRRGLLEEKYLGDESLLEFYFIDVGQGDGVLIRTPDGRHILVDGGYKRDSQPSGKNAADFVDWKFAKDYKRTAIDIDVMISSHPDADHYGGLWDLLNPNEIDELDLQQVNVGQFYHCGVSWWKKNGGARTIGDIEQGLLTTILEDNQHISQTELPGSSWKLQGDWGSFIKLVNSLQIPTRRLYHEHGTPVKFLPGFNQNVEVRVLGPVQFENNGKKGYRAFSGTSQNTNGHSVALRFDYGDFRLLLTGDLNAASQKLLLESHRGTVFQSDVTKACHHGSDDCSLEFLQHIQAGATVISSGDSESHDHPRPAIVAASALTGFLETKNDKLITPLVYSTEISRSYKLGKPVEIVTEHNGVETTIQNMHDVRINYNEVSAGALNAARKSRTANKLYVVGGIVYGLVNVRTDGKKVICATLNENSAEWQVRTFKARF
ncbi:MBL fold metallo-hydrolase [Dyadobacter sp. LHD-138]|uniref:ComEC/Rec2 family competence protein n=1 Tax=Dyadobacter sp. LHD-138 TaxID=3071413 RepID=UPI0027DF02CB|nr:MBL fold metallo-hydrolase [Dyadobacter sp. LHD-138]MDQ6477272.1 MBL fold metallo-hydrolase [Dyadobacter sp. LHD-138]